MAKKRQTVAEQLAEFRRRHDEEERHQRAIIIKEFSIESEDTEATMHAMAGAILKYRRALKMLEKALGFATIGAPFGVLGPGPHGHPWRSIDGESTHDAN